MNRTFKTVIGWWYWLLIFVSSFFLIFFFWKHDIIIALIMAVLVIYEIEMLIHTQYIITSDGMLKIETGRFVKSFTLQIKNIESVRNVRSMVFWAPSLSFHRLEIKYTGNNKTVKIQVSPRSKDEFLSKLRKHNGNIKIE